MKTGEALVDGELADPLQIETLVLKPGDYLAYQTSLKTVGLDHCEGVFNWHTVITLSGRSQLGEVTR